MKKKYIITEDIIIEQEIANRIHQWMFNNEDQLKFPGPKYSIGLDRVCDIVTIIREAMVEAKKKIEKYKDRLNGNVPKWTASVLLNEGYGKQCKEFEAFEAETKEEALKIIRDKVEELFSDKPNVDIIDMKVEKYKQPL